MSDATYPNFRGKNLSTVSFAAPDFLRVRRVENGFTVSEAQRGDDPWTKTWAFADAESLGEWMKRWGEAPASE